MENDPKKLFDKYPKARVGKHVSKHASTQIYAKYAHILRKTLFNILCTTK